MALLSAPRVIVPGSIAIGEVFQVKTIIGHSMNTGLSRGQDGEIIPRNIINEFVCRYNGTVAFRAELFEAMSSNPYFEFRLRARESGTLDFTWVEDGGATYFLTRDIVVI